MAACQNLLIRFTTASFTSPTADASVCTAKQLISSRSSQGKPWGSKKSKKVFRGQLYGVRSRLHRSGGKNSAASRQPFSPKSVTYVSGTICYLCVRAGPSNTGGEGGIRTHGRG